MKCSINFDAVKSGWSIVFIEGSQVFISKNKFVVFLNIVFFFLANSADPGEMLYFAKVLVYEMAIGHSNWHTFVQLLDHVY